MRWNYLLVLSRTNSRSALMTSLASVWAPNSAFDAIMIYESSIFKFLEVNATNVIDRRIEKKVGWEMKNETKVITHPLLSVLVGGW